MSFFFIVSCKGSEEITNFEDIGLIKNNKVWELQSSNLILFLAILHTIKKKKEVKEGELMQRVERALVLYTRSCISAALGSTRTF